MPDPSNYYALLQVQEDATGAEIKRAYRTLAQTVHPDCAGGDAQQFRQIAEAYEVLGDPSRRRRYDAMRRDPLAAHLDPSAEPANGAARPNRVDDAFGSLFTDLFQRERSTPTPSLDVEAQVRLSFDQALQGGKTEVRLPSGKLVRLTVPRGVRSQARARIRGYGHAHPDRPDQRGDLYVTFRVDQSPRFRREGDHLHVTETVTAPEAMTGTMRSIQNAYGRTIRIQIPPGTQPGERLRLRGQGVETEDGAGDLFVEIRVAVPRHLTPTQHRALESCFRDLGLL